MPIKPGFSGPDETALASKSDLRGAHFLGFSCGVSAPFLYIKSASVIPCTPNRAALNQLIKLEQYLPLLRYLFVFVSIRTEIGDGQDH